MDIALVIVALLLFVVGPVVVVNRDLLFNRSGAKHKQYTEPPLPFLIIPTSPGASSIQPAGTVQRQTRAPERPSVKKSEPDAELFEHTFDSPLDYSHPAESSDERFAQPPIDLPVEPMRVAPLADVRGGIEEADDLDEPSTDATVVFHRPVDEAVQILPGRLHVLSGDAAGRDIRLVSRIGEAPHIVVGRETGPPYRHITLEAPTVSRRHARIDFVDGHWTITNLSKTNPVLVNNRALLNGGTARKLSHGDCIELGEVALRFLAS